MTKTLKGQERRDLIKRLATERAEFEIEYEGQRVVAFDRGEIVSNIPAAYRDAPHYAGDRGTINIVISDDFVAQCQRNVAPIKAQLLRWEAAGDIDRIKRYVDWAPSA